MLGQGGSNTKTVTMPPGTYQAECYLRGWANYICWVTVSAGGVQKFDGRTTPSNDGHQYHSGTFTLTAATSVSISGGAPAGNSCFACGAVYKIS